MIDKQLALAFDFDNAPKEVLAAAKAHRANDLALADVEKQIADLNQQAEQIRKAFAVTRKEFASALDRWEPGEKSEAVTSKVP